MISQQPVKGPLYIKRIKSGLLADGLNSVMAATFNSLPMVTFAQNNGVIQLTGVASRYVAYFIAGLAGAAGAVPDDRRGVATDAQAGTRWRHADHVRHRGRGRDQDPRRSRGCTGAMC